MFRKACCLTSPSFGRIVLLIGLLLVAGAPGLARASSPPEPHSAADMPVYQYANCRLGVAAWPDDNQQFDIVESLNAGWYIDFWTTWTPSGPTQAEYAQMVRVRQNPSGGMTCEPEYGYTISPALTDDGLGGVVAARPGSLWIIGNEPDRIGGGGVCPQQYAQAYHDAYMFIKNRDATAQVAVAGLVEFTPMRRQYMDLVWDTYLARYGEQMPVDVWTLHLYALSETNDGDAWWALGTDPGLAIPYSDVCSDPNTYCHAEHDNVSLFVEQAVRMRTWMKDHGQRNKPLLVTEYGILKPYNYYGTCSATDCYGGDVDGCFCDETKRTFHPGRVADFMEATFDYLLSATDAQIGFPLDNDRLVQQWLWYRLATHDAEQLGHASRLAISDAGYALADPGLRWQQYARALPPEINLFGLAPAAPIITQGDGPLPVTVSLRIAAMNDGNTALTRTVMVTFYSNAALTQAIGSTTLSGLGGCARRTAVLSVPWANLNAGRHSFWARLDSTGVVAESNEGDNVVMGEVWVDPTYRLLLPAVRRG